MRRYGSWTLTAPSALFFLVCFVAPTIYLLLASFGRVQSYALSLEFNLGNYVEVFAGYWDSLLFTFAMAFLIACCTTRETSGRHLHMLLAEMADGAALMAQAGNADARRMGLLKVVQALNLYGDLFDHPGWQPLDESIEISGR